jgi:tetratricopeptide (TPR) repeat protein
VVDDLRTIQRERGREQYQRRAWAEAFGSFQAADRASALDAEDLELYAMTACLTGRDDEYLSTLDRAHHAHLQSGARLRAARCAFWLALRLLFRGEAGHATGWLTRAERLVECEGGECVERGYLLLPIAERHLRAGDAAAAHASASAAVEIAERFREADLLATARHLQGRALILQGDLARGLAFLDETMIAVASGSLSPLVTGLMYCSVIAACQEIYAIGRAREWTAALAQWCDDQPDLVAFSDTCLVHRAEIAQLRGLWDEAIAHARRASQRHSGSAQGDALAAAWYACAEVHRLRGSFVEAEEAYRKASDAGLDPQPGLALLRLAQGQRDVAARAIRRAAGTNAGVRERTMLLPPRTRRAASWKESPRVSTRKCRAAWLRTRADRWSWRVATPTRR